MAAWEDYLRAKAQGLVGPVYGNNAPPAVGAVQPNTKEQLANWWKQNASGQQPAAHPQPMAQAAPPPRQFNQIQQQLQPKSAVDPDDVHARMQGLLPEEREFLGLPQTDEDKKQLLGQD